MIALDTRKIIETGKQANPFPGLRPFEYYENHLFFGRDGQSERLIEKLSRKRFLTVVGSLARRDDDGRGFGLEDCALAPRQQSSRQSLKGFEFARGVRLRRSGKSQPANRHH